MHAILGVEQTSSRPPKEQVMHPSSIAVHVLFSLKIWSAASAKLDLSDSTGTGFSAAPKRSTSMESPKPFQILVFRMFEDSSRLVVTEFSTPNSYIRTTAL
jgi:hypothetical protein